MRVTRLRYRHPLEPNFRRVVYQLLSPDSEASRVLVCYEWATEPHLLQKSLQHIQDNRPKITTSRVPTVSAANVYILETERDLVAEQQAQVGGFGWKVVISQVIVEIQRPIIPRQRRGRIPIETPIHSRYDVDSHAAHIDGQHHHGSELCRISAQMPISSRLRRRRVDVGRRDAAE